MFWEDIFFYIISIFGKMTSLYTSYCSSSRHSLKMWDFFIESWEEDKLQKSAFLILFFFIRIRQRHWKCMDKRVKEKKYIALVFKWHKLFRDGRGSCNDDERSGCPTSLTTESNVSRMRYKLDQDSRITLTQLSEYLSISYGSLYRTLFIKN